MHFPNRAVLNPGGLAAFYFIPTDQVLSVPTQTNGRLDAALVLADAAHFYAGYATSDTLKYSEKSTKTAQGTYYTHNLSGNYPGDRGEVQALFAKMEILGGSYYVIFEDMLGLRRLAGYGGGLKFSANYDSESKRYSFTFEGDSLERAPIYPYSVLF